MKKNCIQLRSVQNYHLRFVTEAQAVRLVDAGTHVWRDSRTVQSKGLERQDQQTAASITPSESISNSIPLSESFTAGLSEEKKLERAWKGEDAEDYIERAHDKVMAWPIIGDTKAVRVLPTCPA